VEEAQEAKLVVSRLHSEPRGVLKITASVAFGTLHIAPAIPEFLARYPEIRIDMTINDRYADLAEEGYDVAIRITKEPDLNLVARELAPIHHVVCATPDYFRRHGTPESPSDLARHNCLIYAQNVPREGEWRFMGEEQELIVPIAGNLRLNDDEAIWQAALGGLGVALLPTFMIGKDLQAGNLQAVLSEYVPVQRRIYAVYLPNRHLSAKVRAFIDFLLARFGPQPYWDQIQQNLSAAVEHRRNGTPEHDHYP
jgi:DNA-binding transcriptional LysR family regulator